MNETLKVLEERRSCRNFKPDMITEDELQQILRAGTYAATGMGNSLRLLLQSQRKNSVTNLRKRTARSWVHRKAWIRSMEHR